MESSINEEAAMSDFPASPFGDHMTISPIQVDSEPGNSGMRIWGDCNPHNQASCIKRARPIMEPEWPQLKALLQHLYIDKDQNLKTVQRYIRDKYNLIVTYSALCTQIIISKANEPLETSN